MKREIRMLAMLIAFMFLVAGTAPAQEASLRDQESGTAAEERLESVAERLRLGLAVASVAAYAPTISDLRLHAQQIVNLLEGVHGPHYVRPPQAEPEGPGLLPELVAVSAWFEGRSGESGTREPVARALKNTRTYLSLARDAALSIIGQRQFDRATQDMLRVYAYLAAAYETPCDAAYVPALRTLLRLVDLAEPPDAE